MSVPIPSCRALFDIPEDIAYFNCAYLSPLLRAAVAAGEAGLRRKAQPWRIAPVDFFDEAEHARGLFARLIGAAAEDVAIVPAASYGVATAARAVPVQPGQRIVVLAEQFPSNVYAWREAARTTPADLVTVPRPEDGDWTGAVIAALDDRTAVAALPNCHWADGGLLDLERIGTRCREVGAALVLDLTQSLGALPFDVGRVRPDAVIAAGYKWLLGPYSLGFTYLAPHRQDVTPIEHNWIDRAGSEDFAGLVAYRDEYQPGARRFDVGERANFALMPVAIAALEQILEWRVEGIATSLRARTDGIEAGARARGIVPSLAREARAGHFLGLRLPAGSAVRVAERLAREQVFVSVRGETLRVTPHLHNTDADADRLLEALGAAT